jgi:hypothetical protein
MQQLCPQLTSLHLTIRDSKKGLVTSPRLPHLASPCLQALTLTNGRNKRGAPLVWSPSLAHLTNLQQLTLDGVVLVMCGVPAAEEGREIVRVLQQLPALQQLRLHHADTDLGQDAELVSLANKLVDYEVCIVADGLSYAGQTTSGLTSFVHLTRLVLRCRPHEQMPEGTVQALAALTGLQELGLRCAVDSRTAGVVQQAAGMAQLRSLQLVGSCVSDAGVAACLARCAQLTSLVLLVEDASGAEEPDGDEDEEGETETWVPALQRLRGLRSLTIHEELLGCERGAWLAGLTQLSSLCVNLNNLLPPAGLDVYPQAPDQMIVIKARLLVKQVQLHRAGLQQVTFWVSSNLVASSFSPMSVPCGTQVTVWLERQGDVASGWARPLRSWPHLPGVWELQGPAPLAGRLCHLV